MYQLSDLWDAFVAGCREARSNPAAGEPVFQRGADAYVKSRMLEVPELWALSLWEPWATLVLRGAKRYETRPYSTKHRGLVAIHTVIGYPAEGRSVTTMPRFSKALGGIEAAIELMCATPSTRGKIIAVSSILDCQRTEATTVGADERLFGDYTPGRWAFELGDVFVLPERVKVRGHQRMWRVPQIEASQVHRQLPDEWVRRQRDVLQVQQRYAEGNRT